MGIWLGVLTVLVGMGSAVAGAQTEKDAQKAFEKAVVGQAMFLRNFSAQSQVDAEWKGGAVVFGDTFVRGMSVVMVDSVKVKSDEVELSGRRFAVVADPASGWKQGVLMEKVWVHVAISKSDRAAAFTGLRDGLFFAGYEAAMAVLPKNHGGKGPRDDKGLATSIHMRPDTAPERLCDCSDRGTEACKGKIPGEGLTQMKLVHNADPQFSEEARAKKISGNVMVSLMVDPTGTPQDVWIERPMGYGLDEKAAQAVLKYVFQPQACHDKGEAVEIHVDVNFQIF